MAEAQAPLIETRRAELAATWSARGVEAPEGGSLGATLRSPSATPLHATSRGLPALLATEDGAPQLALGAVLGEGGMGVVRSAMQTALGREVAVKTLRDDTPSQEAAAQLLREARVTGGLEHPNVVPVHALGRDESGRPLIVMKRIEGRPWSELLASATSEPRGSDAFLERHLRILAQVARALHFAHTRGVLHRDLKPDNVMIGSFGEIYVVDWGIAVALDRGAHGLPIARDVRRVEGTPVYLAPEMAAGDGEALDARTDVYLLGATLHEILTGAAPHAATSVQAALVRAFVSEPPEYDASVSPELASVAHRALARLPSGRFENAATFADAIEEVLAHRGAAQLREAAERRTEELARHRDLPEGERADAQISALFHEARFAFEQVLRAWPEDARAREGRVRLLTTMIAIELDRGSLSAAESLLRELGTPESELPAELRTKLASERERAARLVELERDADMGLGARTRQALTYLASITWGLACFACGWTTRTGLLEIDHRGFAAVNLGFCIGTALSMLHQRREMLANAVNRRVTYTTCLVFATGALLWPVLELAGVSMPHATVVGALVAASLWTTAVLTLGRPWIPMVVGDLLVVVFAWWLPEWHFEIFGLLGAAQALLAARLMAPR